MKRSSVLKATLVAAVAAVALLGAQPGSAKTFTWANDGDVSSMDPYARNETFLLSFMANVYEPLVRRDRNLKLEAALAEKWTQVNPTLWRFNLRHNVKFQGGEPFTADDVVFSYGRAMGKGSNVAGNFTSVKDTRKVDDFTVEVDTKYPDPLLADKMAQIGIMSKIWAEKNNALNTADMTKNEENFATRNANGTGPFKVTDREPDVKTVLEPYKDWWDKPQHNLTKVVFQRIANDATRVAALLSGDVDLVQDVPVQDIERLSSTDGFKVETGPENRVIYFGYRFGEEPLRSSNITDSNPFNNPLVREAMELVLDRDAIQQVVMRGNSIPTGVATPPFVNGWTEELDAYPAVDVERARELMAEAGYPDGFSVTLDTPNNRYVNDEAISTAYVGMLAQIGIQVTLASRPVAEHSPIILANESDFYLLGWGVPTFDSAYVFNDLIHTKTETLGTYNVGLYSNPELDEMIVSLGTETDLDVRNQTIAEIWEVVKADRVLLPVHNQVLAYAMREDITLPVHPENQPRMTDLVIE